MKSRADEIERARAGVATAPMPPLDVVELMVNPTLRILDDPGEGMLLIWRHPEGGATCEAMATAEHFLALKLAHDGVSFEEAARLGAGSARRIERVVRAVAREGIVLLPTSHLQRKGEAFPDPGSIPRRFREVRTFTLQWHLTNECELHCKHCYDRTQPSPLTLERAQDVVADLVAFCRRKRVRGSVSLTGGNPLLFRDFMPLYETIARTELSISILGNPTTPQRLARLCAIRPPTYYQVSLEGLEEHNDHIRGRGYFGRVLSFLPMLREAGIRSVVMLTLTRANLEQVLPLAERLRGVVDRFAFNRLSEVGEGASLESPTRDEFRAFLVQYKAAARNNPTLGEKDDLLNILRHESGEPLQGGCTGKGCGAAFNFMALLPDGEAHACRKFPSPLGNVLSEGIDAVYGSPAAEEYRQGCAGCTGCPIRHACGGCLAVAAGSGLDPFVEVDPHCFIRWGDSVD